MKNLSLLGLVLMAASAVTAAVSPNKPNTQRINNGTLRAFSDTAVGADRDAEEAAISCWAISGGQSRTASATNTTTGLFSGAVESVVIIDDFYYLTINNTSQTNLNDGVDQNSVRFTI